MKVRASGHIIQIDDKLQLRYIFIWTKLQPNIHKIFVFVEYLFGECRRVTFSHSK